jgi:hypothetical protein
VLKKQGAQVTILLTQIPNSCVGNSISEIKLGKNANKHPVMCQSSNDHLMGLLNRLPPDSVDAVIVGGGMWARGFHNGIPIIQSQGESNYFSLTELYFDTSVGKTLKAQSKIYFPIKTCHQFVLSTQDCYRDEFEINPLKREADRGSDMALMPAKFLGLEVIIP